MLDFNRKKKNSGKILADVHDLCIVCRYGTVPDVTAKYVTLGVGSAASACYGRSSTMRTIPIDRVLIFPEQKIQCVLDVGVSSILF